MHVGSLELLNPLPHSTAGMLKHRLPGGFRASTSGRISCVQTLEPLPKKV